MLRSAPLAPPAPPATAPPAADRSTIAARGLSSPSAPCAFRNACTVKIDSDVANLRVPPALRISAVSRPSSPPVPSCVVAPEIVAARSAQAESARTSCAVRAVRGHASSTAVDSDLVSARSAQADSARTSHAVLAALRRPPPLTRRRPLFRPALPAELAPPAAAVVTILPTISASANASLPPPAVASPDVLLHLAPRSVICPPWAVDPSRAPHSAGAGPLSFDCFPRRRIPCLCSQAPSSSCSALPPSPRRRLPPRLWLSSTPRPSWPLRRRRTPASGSTLLLHPSSSGGPAGLSPAPPPPPLSLGPAGSGQSDLYIWGPQVLLSICQWVQPRQPVLAILLPSEPVFGILSSPTVVPLQSCPAPLG